MASRAMWRPEPIEPGQHEKLRMVFRLLEENLLPEERDRGNAAYRLGWYENLQARRFSRADMEHFRRFVDDMSERALELRYRTEALFPSDSAMGLNAQVVEPRILQARSICEGLTRPED